jgi:serine/threonine protein kinase
MKIDRTRIESKELLGSGYFGEVSKAILKAQTINNDYSVENGQTDKTIAVKTVKFNKPHNMTEKYFLRERSKMEESFLFEAQVMANLNGFHVVKLIGLCVDYHPYLIVMEFMDHGDLLSFVKDEVKAKIRPLTQIALEIADGMLCLEHMNILHCDLAARNCLVASDYTVKVSDFGLSKVLKTSSYYKANKDFPRPIRHMAPESLSVDHFGSSSDVFSYGIVLYELTTNGEIPYSVTFLSKQS